MKCLKPILFAFSFFNPIVLLILFKSYWIAILLPLLIVVGGYYLSKLPCLRLIVWAFNIFAIIGLGLNAELVFRSLYQDKNVPNIYKVRGNYYLNKPLLNQKFDDEEFCSRYLTNCQGYRMDDSSNPNDTIKFCDWLFLGDSFTQGAQVNYGELFSSLISCDFPDKTIVNAGMSGAGLYESLNYLKDEGAKLKPKRIFLQIGAFNDFYNIKERHAGWSEYLMEYSDLYRYLQYNILDNPDLPLGRWTEPFFDNREENAKYNIFFKQTSEEKEADNKVFARVIREFKQESDKLDAELIVLLIPSKEQVSDDMLADVKNHFNIKDDQLDMQAPNKLTRKICEEQGVRLIDLYSSFRTNPKFPFFFRDEHLNSEGHELIASEITKALTNEKGRYIAFSRFNKNERYPTFFDDGMSVLFQATDGEQYRIISSNLIRSREDVVWTSPKELIHPIISRDGKWLAFAQGDQDNGETDIILFNRQSNEDIKVNPSDYRGAIPMFSNNSKLIAYPKWKDNENPVIAIYDIEKGLEVMSIGDAQSEVWRPIFSPDDLKLYYIQIENDGLFGIRSYDLSTQKEKQILKLPFNIWDIAISPNCEKIVFAGNKDNNWDLFIYDIPTGKVNQLTHTLGNEWDPVFYSDSELWFAGEFGFNNGIYHIELKE